MVAKLIIFAVCASGVVNAVPATGCTRQLVLTSIPQHEQTVPLRRGAPCLLRLPVSLDLKRLVFLGTFINPPEVSEELAFLEPDSDEIWLVKKKAVELQVIEDQSLQFPLLKIKRQYWVDCLAHSVLNVVRQIDLRRGKPLLETRLSERLGSDVFKELREQLSSLSELQSGQRQISQLGKIFSQNKIPHRQTSELTELVAHLQSGEYAILGANTSPSLCHYRHQPSATRESESGQKPVRTGGSLHAVVAVGYFLYEDRGKIIVLDSFCGNAQVWEASALRGHGPHFLIHSLDASQEATVQTKLLIP